MVSTRAIMTRAVRGGSSHKIAGNPLVRSTYPGSSSMNHIARICSPPIR